MCIFAYPWSMIGFTVSQRGEEVGARCVTVCQLAMENVWKRRRHLRAISAFTSISVEGEQCRHRVNNVAATTTTRCKDANFSQAKSESSLFREFSRYARGEISGLTGANEGEMKIMFITIQQFVCDPRREAR